MSSSCITCCICWSVPWDSSSMNSSTVCWWVPGVKMLYVSYALSHQRPFLVMATDVPGPARSSPPYTQRLGNLRCRVTLCFRHCTPVTWHQCTRLTVWFRSCPLNIHLGFSGWASTYWGQYSWACPVQSLWDPFLNELCSDHKSRNDLPRPRRYF